MKQKKKRRKKSRRGHYKRGTFTSVKTQGICNYRSGWELAYMQYLDSSDVVKSFEYENIVIPYVSNIRTGKQRKYYPDFLVEYVDGHRELVEIKPKKRLQQVTVQKKLKAAEEWCRASGVTLVVITECELKVLHLLK